MSEIAFLTPCKECGHQDYTVRPTYPRLSQKETTLAATMFRLGADTRTISDRLGKSEAAVANSLHHWREIRRNDREHGKYRL